MVVDPLMRAAGRRRLVRRKRGRSDSARLDTLKGALFSTVAAYVALCILLPFADDPQPTPANLCRAGVSFFALTGLGLLLFRRIGLLAVGVSLAAFALGLETARALPALHHAAEPLDAVAHLTGIFAAVGLVALVRMFRAQPRGVSPASLAYLP